MATAVIVLAACSSNGDDDDSETPETANAGDPVAGGTLIHSAAADPTVLLPPLSTGPNDNIVGCKIFDSLIELDSNFEPQPRLAQSWEISEDGKTYTFHLQEDVVWQDGEPFSSEDVKFSLEEITAKYAPRTGPIFQQYVTSVDAPDPNTVVINLKKPFGPFIHLLGCSDGAIAAKHIFEGTDIVDNPAVNEPIGTGPFKLESWDRGQTVTLVKNPDYWDEGLPYLDEIVFRIEPDDASRVLSFEAGDTDYVNANMLVPTDWKRLDEEGGFQTQGAVSEPGFMYLIFNTAREPFSDKLARQAVAKAVDREAINQVAYGGLGAVSKSSITPQLSWPYNPDVDLTATYPYDPDAAQDLLDEAGLTDGTSVSLTYDSTDGTMAAAAEIIAENLRQVGIEVELEGTSSDVAEPQAFEDHDFDMTLWGYTTFGDPTLGIERVYATRFIDGGSYTNASQYSNPEVDALFQAGASTPVQEERAEAFFQVQEILAEDIPTLPIVDDFSGDVAQNYVHNVWGSGSTDNYNFDEVWVDSQ